MQASDQEDIRKKDHCFDRGICAGTVRTLRNGPMCVLEDQERTLSGSDVRLKPGGVEVSHVNWRRRAFQVGEWLKGKNTAYLGKKSSYHSASIRTPGSLFQKCLAAAVYRGICFLTI